MTDGCVHVSNNIYLTSSPILYLSKVFGLAPLSLAVDGPQWKLSLSLLSKLYSFLLGITLVTFTLYGIINEIKMGEDAFRMKSSTSKYVTCADVVINQMVVIGAVINIPLLSKNLFTFIKCISEVDAVLDVNDIQHARKVSIFSLSAIMSSTACLLGFDLYAWHTSAKNSNNTFLITNYLAYHTCYFVIILAECQFAHMGYCIQRRLKIMNDSLRNISYHKNETTLAYLQLFRDNHFLKQSKRRFAHGNRRKVASLSNYERHGKVPLAYPTDDHVLRITKAYLIICDAIDAMNTLFGHVVTIILVSSLLHLTVTPFFFIVELTGKCEILFVILQVLWFFAHFFQLVLIVEPCNGCLQETKTMSAIVCRLLSSSPEVNENYRKQLDLLFGLLQYREIQFSAFGLGTIDRSLVTSMAGAVTIYLVTIIQFQNTGRSETT